MDEWGISSGGSLYSIEFLCVIGWTDILVWEK